MIIIRKYKYGAFHFVEANVEWTNYKREQYSKYHSWYKSIGSYDYTIMCDKTQNILEKKYQKTLREKKLKRLLK